MTLTAAASALADSSFGPWHPSGSTPFLWIAGIGLLVLIGSFALIGPLSKKLSHRKLDVEWALILTAILGGGMPLLMGAQCALFVSYEQKAEWQSSAAAWALETYGVTDGVQGMKSSNVCGDADEICYRGAVAVGGTVIDVATLVFVDGEPVMIGEPRGSIAESELPKVDER